jgi:dihydrofolate reductase
MNRVVFDISMSLDGFVTNANGTPDVLHDWAFGPADGLTPAAVPDTWRPDVFGAIIAGRRTYEDSLPSWGANGPSRQLRLPLVVVAHGEVADPPSDGVYSFASGIDDALAQARAKAGGKDISVMGGGSIGGQFLAAGLLDEIKIHLVPVVLGAGTPLFGVGMVRNHVQLKQLEVERGDKATHLRYAVLHSAVSA